LFYRVYLYGKYFVFGACAQYNLSKNTEGTMVAKYELKQLENLPLFNEAGELLNAILAKQKPEQRLLEKMFPANEVNEIYSHIEKHYSENSETKNIRALTYSPGGLYNAIQNTEGPEFSGIHSKILRNELPDIKELSPLFDKYSINVQDVLDAYICYKLTRKCFIPAAIHPYRTACIAKVLGFDKSDDAKYASTMFLHDSIEDLLIIMGKTSDHMGINSVNRFINKFIHEDLSFHVNLLTNYYTIILKYIEYLYKLSDTRITQDNLTRGLKNLRQGNEIMQMRIDRLERLLSSATLQEPVINSARWLSYKELYIHELAEQSVKNSDYRIMEMKCIDIADNAAGFLSISDEDKINGIIKLGLWAAEGYGLHSTWKPLNNYISEIFNEALLLSKAMLLRDLLSPVYKQSYFVSALQKIKRLKPILYVS
jgi:hypothetical protein